MNKEMDWDKENTASTAENKGLHTEEPLIFEQGSTSQSGVDLPQPKETQHRLGSLRRTKQIGLPGLSEPEIVRHYTRLSRNNYAIDIGLYPLGSCTMKHNPRLNEAVARLSGFSDIHPLQPLSTVQGAMALIKELERWLIMLTGFPTIALSPAAGAQGELCGLMVIRSYLEQQGDPRKTVLVADSAHGTNPATAAMCGYEIKSIPSNASGRLDLQALKKILDSEVAAVMLTNPNTCGLFESQILDISNAVHNSGALLYCDGANFNAIVGKVKPADLGIDIMHLNLHKTFSTPHGGGGPGSGPVAMTSALAPYAPLPWVDHSNSGYTLTEHVGSQSKLSFGRMRAWHGQMGMFVRALCYLISHGGDGLRQVAEDAVLNANYIRQGLCEHYSMPYPGTCMHEVLCDEQSLKPVGLKTLDVAKALIDKGFHPMTIYFPLIVNGAMLIEPTETETKETLDQFIQAMIAIADHSSPESISFLKNAPVHTPRRRLDETQAARHPILRWSVDRTETSN
ncbi:MAG: aminomethyl-transferring glycine dehydrogenase subunit GcvPB [Pseudomonadota bacterium]|nr:aminomethyl-transferring glycine dehydrogenase subunit GcvPB [Pseudomonadota bacterium]